MNSQRKKVIIVTGGSGLIGNEILNYLVNKNYQVVSLDKADNHKFPDLTLRCDLTCENSVLSCIKEVMDKYGAIDGLVNNAYPRTNDWGNKWENILLQSWRDNVDMQLNSTFFITQKISEIMQNQGQGSIVNIASIYGVVGNDFSVYSGTDMTSPAAYSAIKGAIINLSRYLASYLAPYNIRVNCVSPGGIYDKQPEIFIKNYEAKVPLGRLGNPNDISPIVSFLLSDESSYITGQNIIVDGGWTCI